MSLSSDLRASLYDEHAVLLTGFSGLSGGVYDADAVGEISRQATPGAFDTNGEILPCALIKVPAEATIGPHPRGSRASVDVYLYQYHGTGTIGAARDALFNLWHHTQIGGSGVWALEHTSDANGQFDPALGCSLILSAYTITRLR